MKSASCGSYSSNNPFRQLQVLQIHGERDGKNKNETNLDTLLCIYEPPLSALFRHLIETYIQILHGRIKGLLFKEDIERFDFSALTIYKDFFFLADLYQLFID